MELIESFNDREFDLVNIRESSLAVIMVALRSTKYAKGSAAHKFVGDLLDLCEGLGIDPNKFHLI